MHRCVSLLNAYSFVLAHPNVSLWHLQSWRDDISAFPLPSSLACFATCLFRRHPINLVRQNEHLPKYSS
jgi:hypothetical protein